MIYSKSLYETHQEKIFLNSLFQLHKGYFFEYIKDKNPNKVFPFQYENFFKILSLFELLEKSLINNEQKNQAVISSFFELLLYFICSLNSQDIREIFIKKLMNYILENNKSNLFIAKNFLNNIYMLLRLNINFKSDEITILFNYYIKISNSIKENSDIKIIEEINISFANILLCLLLYNNSNEIIDEIFLKIEKMENYDIILSNLIYR